MRFFFLLHCARHVWQPKNSHHSACEIFLFHPQLLVKELMIKWHSWVRMHLMGEMVLSPPSVLALDSPLHGCFLVISTHMLQRCSPVVAAWEAESILAQLWRPWSNVGHSWGPLRQLERSFNPLQSHHVIYLRAQIHSYKQQTAEAREMRSSRLCPANAHQQTMQIKNAAPLLLRQMLCLSKSDFLPLLVLLLVTSCSGMKDFVCNLSASHEVEMMMQSVSLDSQGWMESFTWMILIERQCPTLTSLRQCLK